MSLVSPARGSVRGGTPQTVADHMAQNEKLVLQLKQTLDGLDAKNKRIRELENKCVEYESLLTTHGENAFENFEKKLNEFKGHHVWTVKQLLQQHDELVQRVDSRLASVPRQKRRIQEQKELIAKLRKEVLSMRTLYRVQEISKLSQKLQRTETKFKQSAQKLAKAENALRLAKQTTDDQRIEIDGLRSQNKEYKQRLDAIQKKNTRREATKYSDLFAKASQMVNLEQFKKAELAEKANNNPYLQNVYKEQLSGAKKQISQLQSRLKARRRHGPTPEDAAQNTRWSRPRTVEISNTSARHDKIKHAKSQQKKHSMRQERMAEQKEQIEEALATSINPVAANAALAYIGVDPNSQFLDLYESSSSIQNEHTHLDQVIFPVEDAELLVNRVRSSRKHSSRASSKRDPRFKRQY